MPLKQTAFKQTTIPVSGMSCGSMCPTYHDGATGTAGHWCSGGRRGVRRGDRLVRPGNCPARGNRRSDQDERLPAGRTRVEELS